MVEAIADQEMVEGHVILVVQGLELVVNSGVGTASHQLSVHPSGLHQISNENLPAFWNTNITIKRIQTIYRQTLSTPVGARLKMFANRWAQLGAHPMIVAKLRYGIALDWKQGPPPVSLKPAVISGYVDKEKMDLLMESVDQMLVKGAIQTVKDAKLYPGFYSRLFLVPKPGNKWRPVIDLSALNKFVRIPHFKMETSFSIRSSLRQGEWVTSVDLTDAYFHLPIKRKFQKFFRFHVRGITYQFLAMPFG